MADRPADRPTAEDLDAAADLAAAGPSEAVRDALADPAVMLLYDAGAGVAWATGATPDRWAVYDPDDGHLVAEIVRWLPGGGGAA
jgi:hypothetical protein